jgi:arabinan endo-1,5-alpha-L-arabinosidase
VNPLIAASCPDPAVVRAGDVYYLVATTDDNRDPARFPIRRSTDLADWEEVGHLFPPGRAPTWAVADFWAPEVHRVGHRFVCYYSARHQSGRLCLGAATASSVEGPWSDVGQPLLADQKVDLIHPHHFAEPGVPPCLYWRHATSIQVQQLAPDGLALVGEPTAVLVADLPWEGSVVEGPWVVRRDGVYYLFYAAGDRQSDRTATGVARARSPRGPFEKWPEPILRSNDRWWGPGHGCVVETGDGDRFIYHAWQAGKIGAPGHPSMALAERITWTAGWPRIAGPG